MPGKEINKTKYDLSIIIPVFNAGQYLSECLRSIFESAKSSSARIELVLIDNGSSDNSLSIANEFAKRKTLAVKVIECQKPGASAARNCGVSEAKGEYIWFIDADDYIDKHAISLLLKEARSKKADIVMMGALRIYQDGNTNYLSAVDSTHPDYKSRFVRYGAGPWQFIIRREWWKRCDFRFREGIIHEDMEMISSLILYTDKFAHIDMPLYFYRQTPNSVLHRRVWSEHAYDIFPALKGLYARFKALGADSTYHDELEWFFIWNLLIDSAKDFAEFPEGKPGFARSREMLQKYFPNWRKNRFLKKKPLKLKIRVRLNYYR